MTQEEKQLLLKGICEKFPYGLWVKETLYSDSTTIYPPDKYPTEDSKACKVMSVNGNCVTLHISPFGWKPEIMELRHIKPYLRPMSSMTEEEKEVLKKNYRFYFDNCVDGITNGIYSSQFNRTIYEMIDERDIEGIIDWLNAHHFDYRGLIERGLALEAPEGMYKTE